MKEENPSQKKIKGDNIGEIIFCAGQRVSFVI